MPPAEGNCHTCAELARDVENLRQARDEALLALAREREQLEVTVLNLQRPPVVASAGARPAHLSNEPAPLRYRLVDRLNNGVKRVVGPWHSVLKQSISALGAGRKP